MRSFSTARSAAICIRFVGRDIARLERKPASVAVPEHDEHSTHPHDSASIQQLTTMAAQQPACLCAAMWKNSGRPMFDIPTMWCGGGGTSVLTSHMSVLHCNTHTLACSLAHIIRYVSRKALNRERKIVEQCYRFFGCRNAVRALLTLLSRVRSAIPAKIRCPSGSAASCLAVIPG